VCGELDERDFTRLAAFVETSRAAGYDVAVMFEAGGDAQAATRQAATRQAATRLADGVFGVRAEGTALFPGKSDFGSLIRVLQAGGIPCVSADSVLSPADRPEHGTVEGGTQETDVILIDRQWGMQEAVRHLVAGGRRRIVYAGLNPANSRGRYEGYCRGLKGTGISPLSLITRGHRFEDGRAAADQILAMQPRPDAVVAYDDPLALGLLNRFAELGVKVPGELAVIGFDDRPAAAMAYPPLTTVALPNRELGKAAAEILLRRIGGGNPTGESLSMTLRTHLVVRQSA
jgi:DNA-binding LacI/PurR family transcriptional regulator